MTRMVRIINCEDPERGPKQIVVSAYSPDMKAQLFAEVVDPGREREIEVGKNQVLVISQEMIRDDGKVGGVGAKIDPANPGKVAKPKKAAPKRASRAKKATPKAKA